MTVQIWKVLRINSVPKFYKVVGVCVCMCSCSCAIEWLLFEFASAHVYERRKRRNEFHVWFWKCNKSRCCYCFRCCCRRSCCCCWYSFVCLLSALCINLFLYFAAYRNYAWRLHLLVSHTMKWNAMQWMWMLTKAAQLFLTYKNKIQWKPPTQKITF